MRATLPFLATSLLAALVLAGCGGDDNAPADRYAGVIETPCRQSPVVIDRTLGGTPANERITYTLNQRSDGELGLTQATTYYRDAACTARLVRLLQANGVPFDPTGGGPGSLDYDPPSTVTFDGDVTLTVNGQPVTAQRVTLLYEFVDDFFNMQAFSFLGLDQGACWHADHVECPWRFNGYSPNVKAFTQKDLWWTDGTTVQFGRLDSIGADGYPTELDPNRVGTFTTP